MKQYKNFRYILLNLSGYYRYFFFQRYQAPPERVKQSTHWKGLLYNTLEAIAIRLVVKIFFLSGITFLMTRKFILNHFDEKYNDPKYKLIHTRFYPDIK